MKNHQKTQFTIYGINNTIAILESKRFTVSKIDIVKNGRAEKDDYLMHLVSKLAFQPKFYAKPGFFQKYPDGRTQGIAAVIDGRIEKNELPDYSEKESICL
ncbi:uncharacterized protein METZ01_LOCUS47227, partial [marine metagenome]